MPLPQVPVCSAGKIAASLMKSFRRSDPEKIDAEHEFFDGIGIGIGAGGGDGDGDGEDVFSRFEFGFPDLDLAGMADALCLIEVVR